MLSSCVHSCRSSGSGEHCVLSIKLTVPSSSSLSQVLPRCPYKVLLPLKAWMTFRSFKSIEMTGPQTACLQLTHGKRKSLFFSAFELNLHICHFCALTMVRSSQEPKSSPSYREPMGSSQFGGFCGDDGVWDEKLTQIHSGAGETLQVKIALWKQGVFQGSAWSEQEVAGSRMLKNSAKVDQWAWMPPWSFWAQGVWYLGGGIYTMVGPWYLKRSDRVRLYFRCLVASSGTEKDRQG